MGLALGLRQRDPSPVIVTTEFYRSYIEGQRIEFHPLRPDVDPRDAGVMRHIMNPMRTLRYCVANDNADILNSIWVQPSGTVGQT